MLKYLRSFRINYSLRIVGGIKCDNHVTEERPTRQVLEEDEQEFINVSEIFEGNLHRDVENVQAEKEENNAIPKDFERTIW